MWSIKFQQSNEIIQWKKERGNLFRIIAENLDTFMERMNLLFLLLYHTQNSTPKTSWTLT